MVGHQAISIDVKTVPFLRLTKHFQECLVVAILVKYPLTVITSVEYMINAAVFHFSGDSGHVVPPERAVG
jgi:hypothetical protein